MPKPAIEENEMEVVAQPENDRRQRRRFSREEKIRILAEADRCTARGALTALLRREGLYSSHLTMWRQQLKAHGESGLEPRRAGRPAKSDKRDREIARLEAGAENPPPPFHLSSASGHQLHSRCPIALEVSTSSSVM